MSVPITSILAKDPNATLDYAIDWSDEISDGDSLSSATWTSTPTGLTLTPLAIQGDEAPVVISGGTDGTMYSLQCRYVTASGYTDDRTVQLEVRQR
jgi:hypothetical protein